MKNPCLLSLAPLLLVLVVSSSLPLTAVSQHYWLIPADGQSPVAECTGDGVYAANSTYEANLRRVAALLLSEVSATPGFGDSYATRAVGYWPNRLAASSFCRTRRRDVNGTGFVYPRCADCIAGAFREVERACPYRRRQHTETSHGFGIGISSNWIWLPFLLAISGMAQPEKRHFDAFHPSFIRR